MSAGGPSGHSEPSRRTGAALALLVCLLVAAALRFAALGSLPPAHYRDVALAATDAQRAAAGHPRLHYTYDEGLYSNLMAVFFRLFGASDWTVRAPGALFGVLTCVAVALLGTELGMARAGLWGAALLAVSFWHVVLSRSGFRAVLLPLVLTVALLLLVRAMRRGGAFLFGAAGALFGLGIHVYPSVRFAPLILPAWLLAEIASEPAARRRARRGMTVFLAAAFLVALPMLRDYAVHPEHFNDPRRIVSVFSPKADPAAMPARLGENIVRTILMFHVAGDLNWRHNLSGAAMLDPLTGALFLLGLLRMGRPPLQGPPAALLGGWIAAMLLPNILSIQGVPHGLRSSGSLPAVMLVAGAGLAVVVGALERRLGRKANAIGAAALLLLGGFTARQYFVIWGGNPMVAEAHDSAYRAAARVLLEAPPGVARILVANGGGFPAHGHPVETQVYLFEMRDAAPEVLGPKDTGRLVLEGRPALVALIQRDDRVLRILRDLNPGAPIVPLEAPGLSGASPVYRVN